jgi:uncharacterized protein (DUF2236 family)
VLKRPDSARTTERSKTEAMNAVQSAIAEAIRSRVVGGDGSRERGVELFSAPGPRWFAKDRPIRIVHSDTSMFIGGVRAILLQSLHPVAMSGVAQHSDYRNDPWGRLQRTADFMAATTFGPANESQRAVDLVHRVHKHVTGTTADGIAYEANDPHLLAWVHAAEVDSFLVAHDRYGAQKLTAEQRDGYVEDMAVIAEALGAERPPHNVAELKATLQRFQPELRTIPEARAAARFLLLPPLSPAALPVYSTITAAAVSLLPWWARLSLRLPLTPIADAVLVRPASQAVVSVIRWALTPGSPTAATE